MKKGIKNSITQVLEIPGEVLTDASVMSIVGKNEIDIENYKSLDGKVWDKNYVIYDETDTTTIIKNAIKSIDFGE